MIASGVERRIVLQVLNGDVIESPLDVIHRLPIQTCPPLEHFLPNLLLLGRFKGSGHVKVAPAPRRPAKETPTAETNRFAKRGVRQDAINGDIGEGVAPPVIANPKRMRVHPESPKDEVHRPGCRVGRRNEDMLEWSFRESRLSSKGFIHREVIGLVLQPKDESLHKEIVYWAIRHDRTPHELAHASARLASE